LPDAVISWPLADDALTGLCNHRGQERELLGVAPEHTLGFSPAPARQRTVRLQQAAMALGMESEPLARHRGPGPILSKWVFTPPGLPRETLTPSAGPDLAYHLANLDLHGLFRTASPNLLQVPYPLYDCLLRYFVAFRGSYDSTLQRLTGNGFVFQLAHGVPTPEPCSVLAGFRLLFGHLLTKEDRRILTL
jgi:RNA polymerase sigma factor (sigma-70 family)